MVQYEFVPKDYHEAAPLEKLSPASVSLQSGGGEKAFRFTFETVRPNVFRTTFTSPTHPLPPFPSAAPPAADLGGADVSVTDVHRTKKEVRIGDVIASIAWESTPVVSLAWADSNEVLYRDLPLRSYLQDGTGIAHYSWYDRKALHVGLGEKRAPMNLNNRHFILSATDSFGYDANNTDPLYKHIPLLISATPSDVVAMFSTSHSRGTWSVGSEVDGLWGHFKVYRQDHGGLEEYLLVGKTLKEVVRSYAELVGYPLLMPRWAFGYISGGMKYSMLDSPRAVDAMMEFAKKLKYHDIPCSAHQMSSGYTFSEQEPKTRNVFTWNRHRFPDPEDFTRKYHEQGIRLLSNIKPFVLKTHPAYRELAQKNALFVDPNTNATAEMLLWSAGGGEGGVGSHIDFTSKAGFDWWYAGVKELKRIGIDAMWNDNNEYTLPNDHWRLALETVSPRSTVGSNKISNTIGIWGRAMHTELMGKASYDALMATAPAERPFVLSRSASAGTGKYAASSWSGDNVTSWADMKAANALSLNAGMSLLQCYGHDIGGFEGPQPSPELLLRWIQIGIHSSRFAINCYKTSPRDNTIGDVIEPWMYPEITPLVRAAIKRRYELIPYIYSLALESHLTASPPQRWIGWGYESDPEVWSAECTAGEEQYWLGDTLMVGGVFAPGVDTARMYLPTNNGAGVRDYGYVNLNSPHEYLAAGQWVTISSPWRSSIPLLAKIGGAIPVGKPLQTRLPGEKNPICTTLPEDDYRGIEIFPPHGSSHGHEFVTTWFEDDGISRWPEISTFEVGYSATEEMVTVKFTPAEGNEFVPPWKDLHFILPVGDVRRVWDGKEGRPLESLGEDDKGRQVYKMLLNGEA